MMLLKLTSFALALVCCGQPATGQENQVEYHISCQITSADGTTVNAPRVRVFDGQAAEIRDQTQTPFVTGLKANNGVVEPVIEVLEAGFAIELKAEAAAGGKIYLAVKATHSEIKDVDEVQLAAGGKLADGTNVTTIQAPTLEAQTIRGGRAMQNGGQTEFTFPDGSKLQFTVSQVK